MRVDVAEVSLEDYEEYRWNYGNDDQMPKVLKLVLTEKEDNTLSCPLHGVEGCYLFRY